MTVDSFLNGDFMDASDDEDIEQDEQVHYNHPSMVFYISLIPFYRNTVTRIQVVKAVWTQTMTALLGR